MSDVNRIMILVVEDSQTQAEKIRYQLEKHNYEVIVACDGKQAFEILRNTGNHKPSLVITDIIMSEMNGYDLCLRIKTDEDTMNIPVILLTSLSRSEDIFEGISCGADNFISKPYSEDFLISQIEQILANREIHQNDINRKVVEIIYGGKRHYINSGHQQILTLLISTYEAAVQRNDELIQARDDLKKLNENLEELVNKRTSELSKINAEKDKFFSIIAHDLRSPFQGLLYLTELMADVKENYTVSELTDFSKSLNISANNLYQLLENLLIWAMVENGSLSITPKQLNLSAIVLQNIGLINERVVQKRITIVNEVPDNQVIYADEEMINTILRNLISNAVKFTSGGGIVTIRSKIIENIMIEISVNDTGVGMPEDIVKKLFKIDEQVGSKGTDGELSTGLGLILCREFVEKHGGTIWTESIIGKGSSFMFTIPATQ
jgi:signal transduction histidine kinase